MPHLKPITIDDSEDEAPARTRRGRTQAVAVNGSTAGAVTRASKRKRDAAQTEVDIDLSAEEAVERPARRRRGQASGAARTDPGEVIVIED